MGRSAAGADVRRARSSLLRVPAEAICLNGLLSRDTRRRASTIILAYLAREFGGKFTSIDIYAGAIACAGAYLANHGLTAELVCDDSIDALRKIDAGVDVLYLDSYDYEEKNPLPCQLHQAIEVAIMIPKMSANALILLDGCSLPQGGKARLADMLLRECGWTQWRADAQLTRTSTTEGSKEAGCEENAHELMEEICCPTSLISMSG